MNKKNCLVVAMEKLQLVNSLIESAIDKELQAIREAYKKSNDRIWTNNSCMRQF